MRSTLPTLLFSLLSAFNQSVIATPKVTLDEVFNGDMLGTNLRYFESIAGPARETYGEQNIYRVAGCNISATVINEVISSLRLALTPNCRADLHSFIGDYAPAHYRTLTFGDFEGLSFYADCLRDCGNAADPVISALWQGPRAVGFTEVLLEAEVVDDHIIDAKEQWREDMQAAKGEDWISDARFNCEREFDRNANQYFKNVAVTAVTIGSSLRTPQCW